MISVVVPACNEESVIARCLDGVLADARPGEIEVVVACNGCSDRTAEIAGAFEGVVVVQSPEASKARALNLGDAHATGFPRLYVDADVRLSTAGVRAVAAALGERALLAAPRPDVQLDGASWPVRAYYRAWEQTPYFRAGFVGCGVYGMSREGRSRFDAFPDVISDDGFVRSLFGPDERVVVNDQRVEVWPPRTLASLIRVKTRSRVGVMQLRRVLPDRSASDRAEKSGTRTMSRLLRQPALWPSLPVYALVKLFAEWRARRQVRRLEVVGWERDESARRGNAPVAGSPR